MTTKPTINQLVRHVREHARSGADRNHYGRYWDLVATWPEERIVNIVRFCKSPQGAIMAVTHFVKEWADG